MNKLRRIIDECVRRALYEGGYWDETATPLVTIGTTPTRGFNGHGPGLDNGPELEPSTQDFEGEKFRQKTENIFVSDNKFMIYKVKNFGNPDIKDSLQFFGNTVEFRRAKDTVDGASKRGNKEVYFRTISPESEKTKVERSDFMYKTFWEFSFDGQEWYILKPHPVQSLKISKFIKK